MAITNFMNLDLPVVLTTLGPEWAEKVNEAFTDVDSHDHSSGKGTKVKVAGLEINDNVDFNNYKPTNLFSVQFQDTTAILSGASNSSSLNSSNGNLYYVNGAGLSVQITSGGSVVSVPAAVQSVETVSVNTNLVISPSDTFVYLIVDTTASRTITLPLASGVAGGRIYIIKDATGTSDVNPITVAASGADLIDGAASQVLNSNSETFWVVGDGAASWYIS